jgi:hypothetical protein
VQVLWVRVEPSSSQRQHLLEGLKLGRGQVGRGQAQPGVVEQHLHRPEPLAAGGEGRGDRRLVGGVAGGRGDALAAGSLQLGGLLGRAGEHVDPGARLGEHRHRGPANAAAAAGDKADPVLKRCLVAHVVCS